MTAKADNIMRFPEKSPYVPCDSGTYTLCKLPKDGAEWLTGLRQSAFERFKAQGLPTQALERFKYTNIAKNVAQWDGVLAVPKGDCPDDLLACGLEQAQTQGWVRELLEREPPGMDKYGDTALWDLNTAYFKHAGVVDIPAGQIVDKPIVLKTHGEDDTYTSLRFILRLGDNAKAVLVEEFDGAGEYWRNRVSQIILGKNARLKHIIIHKDSDQAVFTQFTHISAERDAHYEGFALNMGGMMSRHQIQADLEGVNGFVSFNGLNVLGGKQHGDTTILINHRAAHCNSNQFYRSLLTDEAHGVFQGKVHVFEGAQKTDGYQLSNAILLSDKAVMDTKPELEIYADDVKCSHGATTGQMNEEPLFYLRSRGLSEKDARLLLIRAFVDEVVDKIEDESLKAQIEKDVEAWLAQAL
ncbi:MAG: Fe-S cluster assembly protein SufD [Alphaproteobacteria bacterium]